MRKRTRFSNKRPFSARTVRAALALLWLFGSLSLSAGPVGSSDPFTAVIVLPDDGKSAILDEIDASTESVRLYLYLLSDEEIIRALLRANVRGVDVRVMLEPKPFGGAQTELETWMRLDAAGVDVRWSPAAFRFSHVKLLVVDDAVALIMNLNLTAAAFEENREFGLITTDPMVVSESALLFDADWNETSPADPQLLVVSPVNSRNTFDSLFAAATESIDLYAEVLTDPGMLDALVAAVERGITVRVLMSETDGSSLWFEEPGFLVRSGVEVRVMSLLYVHAKAVVVDQSVLWIGSQNLTANSLDANREVGMITDDDLAIQRVSATFESDWLMSIPLEEPTAQAD